MAENKRVKKSKGLEIGVEKLHLENGHARSELGKLRTDEIVKEESASSNGYSPQDSSLKSASQSPYKQEHALQSPTIKMEKHEEVIGGEVTLKQEPGQLPKLSRSTSHKILSRPPPLFKDYPDKTKEAEDSFELISGCSYTSKYIGSTEHDSMDCDCAEEWGKAISPTTIHSIFRSDTDFFM